MVQVTIKTDVTQTIRLLEHRYRRQLPFATSKTLNSVAKNVQAEVKTELKNKLDRVTPYVLNSVFIKNSRKDNLRAEVFIRDRAASKNPNSLAEIINQQFSGGSRIRTRLEQALTRAGLISSDEFVAPGAKAKLDQYGNMSRGQIQQLLSQIFASPNPAANRSKSSRSKMSARKAGRIFWSRGGDLPRGAYIIDDGELRPLLIVVSKPKYKQRIFMEKIGQLVVDRDFNRIFNKEFEEAARTAR